MQCCRQPDTTLNRTGDNTLDVVFTGKMDDLLCHTQSTRQLRLKNQNIGCPLRENMLGAGEIVNGFVSGDLYGNTMTQDRHPSQISCCERLLNILNVIVCTGMQDSHSLLQGP